MYCVLVNSPELLTTLVNIRIRKIMMYFFYFDFKDVKCHILRVCTCKTLAKIPKCFLKISAVIDNFYVTIICIIFRRCGDFATICSIVRKCEPTLSEIYFTAQRKNPQNQHSITMLILNKIRHI